MLLFNGRLCALLQVVKSELDVTPSEPITRKINHKFKPFTKKLKTANSTDNSGSAYGSDFIDPDDIIHHANGNIYIKNKCKLCSYKSAWDGEMAKHEKKAHNIIRFDEKKVTKKNIRADGNSSAQMHTKPSISLLKAPEIATTEPIMSQKDMNDICAKSANSALKDLASLFGSEDVFSSQTGSNSSTSDTVSKPIQDNDQRNGSESSDGTSQTKKLPKKNTSFFDRFQEKLFNANGEATNLTCQYCGHESKCLTESAAHQKSCGREQINREKLPNINNISSSRCQYCRQRCKSSMDLFNHLEKCPEAMNIEIINNGKNNYNEIVEDTLINKELIIEKKTEPHPMENKVFVWNNINMPMETDNSEIFMQYESTEDKQDNVSLDLSVRTSSSPCSEVSYVSIDTSVPAPVINVTEKIPTHGTDISVAQHKRVFKCPHCTFWASTASRFHVHIVGHLNKKPFECSLCAYRSNWRWDITKHIKLKSVRDPAHENAKVLMTDETGRRNYTKYNKYLTEINISCDHSETSGGSGTRPKISCDSSPSQAISSKTELPKHSNLSTNNLNSLLKNSSLKVSPVMKTSDSSLLLSKLTSDKRRPSTENNRKTLWKCKKCNFR